MLCSKTQQNELTNPFLSLNVKKNLLAPLLKQSFGKPATKNGVHLDRWNTTQNGGDS